MSKTQRLTMLGLAVIVAVAAVIVLQSGDDEETTPQPSAATATATPTASAAADDEQSTPTPTPTPRPLPLLRAGTTKELEVKQGERVRFAARSSEDDEIHVHGYDISKEAPTGETVEMSFKADITGIFEIEFEQAGAPIAELKVEP